MSTPGAEPVTPEAPESLAFAGSIGSLSRELLAAVFDQSADCVKILDASGHIEFVNRNGLCTLEIDRFDTIAGQPWTALWPDDARGEVIESVATALAGRPSRFEAFCPTAKGTPKWWDVSVVPVRDPAGRVFAILSTSRDITAAREVRERMETMAHEMRHRLRNAFAIGGAIIRASGREEPEHAEFAADLAQRLQTLSVTQGSLIGPDAGESLAELVARIAEAFDSTGAGIGIGSLPVVLLDEQQARLIALVVGELATNSLKHGALGAGHSVTIAGEADGGRLALDWREDLPGRAASANAKPGSGYGLMRRMARAYGGTFVVDFIEGALKARLEVPMQEAPRG